MTLETPGFQTHNLVETNAAEYQNVEGYSHGRVMFPASQARSDLVE